MRLAQLAVPVALVALAVPRASSACEACAGKPHAAASASPARGTVAKGVRTVAVEVTGEGFVPSEIQAKPGETVKLAVTRKTERTCATEIVMKDFGVNEPLPLGKTVTVTVRPAKPGSYRFACGMDMVAGALVVR